ncbi:MAG: polysaccharide deacetylase family protein [Saprospiraceae bacterium]|nr:polysaccharide deacetylase family protein [Saprospiraceae bacterium]
MRRLFLFILLLQLYAGSNNAQSISIQERLGYHAGTKLLIIHADDIGVSHSENMASIYAMENGSVNSGSIMVPCPWFPEIAAYASSHPEADFGLHLTITSEWKYLKWGPVSSWNTVPGLVNDFNHFYSSRNDVKSNASAEEIEREIRGQIELALKYGIPITHLDSHMFTLYLKPEYLAVYKKLGKEYKLPILLNAEYLTLFGLDAEQHINEDIVVDKVYMAYPPDYEKGMANYYSESMRTMQPGLNIILLHAAYCNDEMQAVTGVSSGYGAEWRQQDFNFFTSDACKQLISDENIQLITWREIRDKLIK